MSEHLAQVIETAAFDENDIDAGTACFCGTFALAMKSAFNEAELGLIVLNDAHGHPAVAEDGQYYWRHAVVIVEDKLYDIEGEVLLEHLIENYCWNNSKGKGGALVEVAEDVFLAHIDDAKGSLDPVYLENWSNKLIAAKHETISECGKCEPVMRF